MRAQPPFRFGQIVPPEYFVGRQVELATLVTDLRAGVNVVLIAPRRYGKSSLLMRAVEHLRQLDVLTAYVDLERTPARNASRPTWPAGSMTDSWAGRSRRCSVPPSGSASSVFAPGSV